MEPVSVWVRLINFIADVLFIRLVLLRLAVYPLLWRAFPSLAGLGHSSFWLLSYLINAVVIFIYYFVAESTTGMTVGKLLTQTRVVTEYGEKSTARTLLFRTLWRLVPFEPFSWGLNNGWHDRQTGTTVVRIGEEVQNEEEPGELGSPEP
jgi:uncharacterized RDD family membrane protein YckC